MSVLNRGSTFITPGFKLMCRIGTLRCLRVFLLHADLSRQTHWLSDWKRDADGLGVLARLAYEITSGVAAGANISYDEVFDKRVSADITVRFGDSSTTAAMKKRLEDLIISGLIASPKIRNVRVYEYYFSCPLGMKPEINIKKETSWHGECYVSRGGRVFPKIPKPSKVPAATMFFIDLSFGVHLSSQ